MGIVAGNLATMRPLFQLLITNTTRLGSSLRSSNMNTVTHVTSAKSDHPGAGLAKPAGVHIDHGRSYQRDGNFTFLSTGDHKGSEYGVHAWHGDSKEGLVHDNGDVELGTGIYQKSELIVSEEMVKTPDESHKK
jgi:hypothetical protein